MFLLCCRTFPILSAPLTWVISTPVAGLRYRPKNEFTSVTERSAELRPSSSKCYLAKVPQMTIGAIFNTSTCLLLSDQSYPLQVVEFCGTDRRTSLHP
jgi:hypothetical protein